MTGKGESPYNIKVEGKIGWLWNAHLNCSPGGTFCKHSRMTLSNIRNIDQSETFLIILNLNQRIKCCVKSSFFLALVNFLFSRAELVG